MNFYILNNNVEIFMAGECSIRKIRKIYLRLKFFIHKSILLAFRKIFMFFSYSACIFSEI